MLLIAALMLKTRSRIGLPDTPMDWANLSAIVGLGLATGTLSGFFGIGGGLIGTRLARGSGTARCAEYCFRRGHYCGSTLHVGA
jgi:hypothetical protein